MTIEEPGTNISDIVRVPIVSLQAHPDNPRRGNIEAIAASIKEHGFTTTLLVQRSTRRVLVGNHRLRAAQGLGLTMVPVRFIDCDDAQALRILLADNRASDVAGYDDEKLLSRLRSLGDLQGTLFDMDAIEDIEARMGQVAVLLPQEFKGDYADAGQEMEQRAAAAERVAQEMRDVVLTMRPADYATFQENIKKLQKRWTKDGKAPGVIATTMMAVAMAAKGESDLTDLQAKLNRWREIVADKLWAFDKEQVQQFKEDFDAATS